MLEDFLMAQAPFTVAEAARYAGWSTTHIYGLITAGKLDVIPEDLGRGKGMRVSAASLKALMNPSPEETPNE